MFAKMIKQPSQLYSRTAKEPASLLKTKINSMRLSDENVQQNDENKDEKVVITESTSAVKKPRARMRSALSTKDVNMA